MTMYNTQLGESDARVIRRKNDETRYGHDMQLAMNMKLKLKLLRDIVQ